MKWPEISEFLFRELEARSTWYLRIKGPVSNYKLEG